MIRKFFDILFGFFTDQDGQGSRKAIALYASLFFFYIMIKANIVQPDKHIDPYLIFGCLGIILFCLGAITTEFITKFGENSIFKKSNNGQNK